MDDAFEGIVEDSKYEIKLFKITLILFTRLSFTKNGDHICWTEIRRLYRSESMIKGYIITMVTITSLR